MSKHAQQSASHISFHIEPQPGYVILKPLKEEKVGAVYVSDNMNTKDSAGIVVAVGEPDIQWHGDKIIKTVSPVMVGDKVVTINYGVNRYMDFESGETVFFCKFNEIVGIIR